MHAGDDPATGQPEPPATRRRFTTPEVIFIGLLAATNVVLDLIIATVLRLFVVHVVAGILIMVPFNFIFLSLARHVVDTFGTLTMFLTVFGVLAIPLPLFGGVAGPYKIVVGASIGVLLDVAFIPRRPWVRIVAGSTGGAVAWWVATFSTWQLFGLPFVTAFASGLNLVFDITWLVSLPLAGFSVDFFTFATICGLISAGPVMAGTLAGRTLFTRVEQTSIYSRFKGVR